ncbi:hypothetical protein A2U01_0006858, partial [Trifolium medium]|nr:hypothetical protein [Trifolium medium]
FLGIKMGRTRFPQTAPLILPVDQSGLLASKTVLEQSIGGGEGIYRAPNTGSKVPLMEGEAVILPIKSCQDFSLDGGRGCYFALILVELFHISGIVDKLV